MTGLTLDHIVVAAKSLDDGANYIRETLGVEMPAGGAHPLMGTHNRLMRLGDTAFLEVIAVDPAAPKPSRTRWYALDDPAMQQSLNEGPCLIAWVLRSRNIDVDARMAGYQQDEVIRVSRGTLSWRLTVPMDGLLPWDGAFPHIIEWDSGARPWERMADLDCRLVSLTVSHPDADDLRAAIKKLLPEWPDYLRVTYAETADVSAEIAVSDKVVPLKGAAG